MDKQRTGLYLIHLPRFARFLYEHHLTEFVKEQMRLSHELDLPLLKYFESMHPDELLAFATRNAADYLQMLAANKTSEHIQFTKERWLTDQLPRIKRDQILAQDISSISYIRKQAFLRFIPDFTIDPHTIIELIKDIDEYILTLETVQVQRKNSHLPASEHQDHIPINFLIPG